MERQAVKKYQKSMTRVGKTSSPSPCHITPYDIRNPAMTELLTRGVDQDTVADIAIHTNMFFTVTHYFYVGEGSKKQATENFPKL